ncbi:protein of unknown function [Enterobacter cancerogenus]|nr:protein of unknown function [Enterobacter cancerogenus]
MRNGFRCRIVIDPHAVTNTVCQLRRRGPRQCRRQVAARAVFRRRGFVRIGPAQGILIGLFQCVAGIRVRLSHALFRQRIPRRLQPFCLSISVRNIRRLRANLTNQLHFLQALLLLLLVKYRADAAVRMIRITAQVSHILLLVLLIANDERPLAHRRLGRAFRVTTVTASGQQSVRHVPGKLLADAAARTDASALVLRLKVRLVMDIAEAQSTRVQTG